jgi:hypothetical protein
MHFWHIHIVVLQALDQELGDDEFDDTDGGLTSVLSFPLCIFDFRMITVFLHFPVFRKAEKSFAMRFLEADGRVIMSKHSESVTIECKVNCTTLSNLQCVA